MDEYVAYVKRFVSNLQQASYLIFVKFRKHSIIPPTLLTADDYDADCELSATLPSTNNNSDNFIIESSDDGNIDGANDSMTDSIVDLYSTSDINERHTDKTFDLRSITSHELPDVSPIPHTSPDDLYYEQTDNQTYQTDAATDNVSVEAAATPKKKAKKKYSKKSRLSKEDDTLQQLYLEACCAQNHIRKFLSVETFLAKRHEYGGLETEKKKSAFIDQMLDNSIRVNTEGIAQYASNLYLLPFSLPDIFSSFDFWVNGTKMPSGCIGHLYGFSRTKMSKRI